MDERREISQRPETHLPPEIEKQQIVDDIISDFNDSYKRFLLAGEKSTYLYAGDFVKKHNPLELMIPTEGSQFTLSYNDFYSKLSMQQAFLDRVGDIVESRIKIVPDLLTPRLQKIALEEPGKQLYVVREQSKLAAPIQEVRVLFIDRYQHDEDRRYPIAEVIWVRRMDLRRGPTDSETFKHLLEDGKLKKAAPPLLLTAGSK